MRMLVYLYCAVDVYKRQLLGLTASVFSIAGHYAGAGMVLKNGTKVIRPIILVVLALLFIKIIFNL